MPLPLPPRFGAGRPDQERVIDSAKLHLAYQRDLLEGEPLVDGGRAGLDLIHAYLIGQQPHPSVPRQTSAEINTVAKSSRINVMDLVVSSVAQALYVEGYRAPAEEAPAPDPAPPPDAPPPAPAPSDLDAPAWDIWQQNKLDARQAGIHRAALAYGWSYVTVLPGEPVPEIRPWSPRRMIALYGDSGTWPISAMSLEPSAGVWALRLFDAERSYHLRSRDLDGSEIEFISWDEHKAPTVPVVRYLNVEDPDEDFLGEIERLIPLQDQINDTTFELRVAQKYGAFRQRYILGWTTSEEEQKVKANASRLWLFQDPDVKVGEFSQTDLAGYIESREASMRHAAALSQTPAHELIGQLVNLSAEALVAAESSHTRKVKERQLSFGESHEQTLALAAAEAGIAPIPGAQVRWADPQARSFAATVDGLVKLQTMGVPLEVLIERIPGFTQQDVERALAIIASQPPSPTPPAPPAVPPGAPPA